MNLAGNSFKKLTLVSLAGYLFIFAIAAKGVSLYGSHHPQKDELLFVNGIIKKVKLGGGGSSTSFQIEVEGKINRYSSYYGKVWPCMEHIKKGDRVTILAEKNKLSRGEFITGKQYYIWELIHLSRVIVAYEDVHELVGGKEQNVNKYINIYLYVSAVFLIIAYIRKLYLRGKNNSKG